MMVGVKDSKSSSSIALLWAKYALLADNSDLKTSFETEKF